MLYILAIAWTAYLYLEAAEKQSDKAIYELLYEERKLGIATLDRLYRHRLQSFDSDQEDYPPFEHPIHKPIRELGKAKKAALAHLDSLEHTLSTAAEQRATAFRVEQEALYAQLKQFAQQTYSVLKTLDVPGLRIREEQLVRLFEDTGFQPFLGRDLEDWQEKLLLDARLKDRQGSLDFVQDMILRVKLHVDRCTVLLLKHVSRTLMGGAMSSSSYLPSPKQFAWRVGEYYQADLRFSTNIAQQQATYFFEDKTLDNNIRELDFSIQKTGRQYYTLRAEAWHPGLRKMVTVEEQIPFLVVQPHLQLRPAQPRRLSLEKADTFALYAPDLKQISWQAQNLSVKPLSEGRLLVQGKRPGKASLKIRAKNIQPQLFQFEVLSTF